MIQSVFAKIASLFGSEMTSDNTDFVETVKRYIDANKVMVFSKSYCPYCHRAKNYFDQNKIPYEHVELDERADGSKLQSALLTLTHQKTVPNIFINGVHVGGCDDLFKVIKEDKLKDLLDKGVSVNQTPFDDENTGGDEIITK